MSDDLVKRLRDTPNWKRETFWDYKSATSVYDPAPFEAAEARIEELEAERDEALNQLDSARHSVNVLEKRVAKAVEALANVIMHIPDYADTVWIDAEATLAALKGGEE